MMVVLRKQVMKVGLFFRTPDSHSEVRWTVARAGERVISM